MLFNNAKASEYLRYSFKRPLFGPVSNIIESFTFEDKKRLFVADGVGTFQDKCEEGFLCFIYDHIRIAIPKMCSNKNKGSWQYNGTIFNILTNIDSYNPLKLLDMKNTRVVILVKEEGKDIGYFIYSSDKGVDSFSFKKKRKIFTEFHKKSDIGMLSGGCALTKSYQAESYLY